MPLLQKPIYRRNYTGEPVTYVQDEQLQSLLVKPRDFPFDRDVSSAIVLGNGISRLEPDVQLLLNQNNIRVAEGYKTTYACNAAYRDTPADYYIWKTNIFFADSAPIDYTKVFLPNDLWLAYRNCNLIPNIWYMDSGSTAAYLAAFDGAKKVFLFGFDGSDDAHFNIYNGTLGYETNDFGFQKHIAHLTNVVYTYSNVQFYRVRNLHTYDFSQELYNLPNFHEISVRGAILEGDF